MASPSIGETLDHYQIVSKLGTGGMGEVFVAYDTKLHRNVALKVLSETSAGDATTIQRLSREAQAVAALNHPNIVTIYSVEEFDGVHFLSMELVEGKTLAKVIPPGGLSMDDFFELSITIAAALNAAHEGGIVHRDLKPANIMVTTDGRVKMLDFGLAKLREPSDALADTKSTSQLLTGAGKIVGTIPYMSPEHLKTRGIDQKSDIFSLGIILYEMCTGERPFKAESTAELISSILRDTPVAPSEINRQLVRCLDRMICKCLEKEPHQRYQSAADLHNDLVEAHHQWSSGNDDQSKSSIAVLSFVDMSSDKDQEYFCEGLAEELINALMKIENLQVAARSSAFAFRDPQLDIREIGERLSVDSILKGSVRKSGNQVRVSVQLVNVSDGYNLWSEQYDGDLESIFEVQDKIARSIVGSLELALSGQVNQNLPELGTSNAQAYDYYLRGRQLFYRHLRQSFELAMQMFSKAIEQDPNYAKAYSGIANCCYFLYSFYDGGEECLKCADDASRKAIELGPGTADAHASRGGVLSLLGKHDEAETEFERAIELGGQFDAYYLYARDSYIRGDLQSAAALYSRASELNPDDYQTPLLVAQICDDLGRPGRAEIARRKGVELIQQRLLANPDDVRALYLGANGLIVLGQEEKSLEWASLAVSLQPDDPYVLYNVACVYALAGKTDVALDFLEQTILCGMTKRSWLDRDSNLDSLRSLPRFRELQDSLV